MRVAVVGSRDYPVLEHVRWFVRTHMQAGDVLISGGARGVDAAAEAEARRCGIAVESLRPNYDLHGRRAPLVRNAEVVTACDLLVGFWDGKSHGTMHACTLARKAGTTVRLFQLPQV